MIHDYLPKIMFRSISDISDPKCIQFKTVILLEVINLELKAEYRTFTTHFFRSPQPSQVRYGEGEEAERGHRRGVSLEERGETTSFVPEGKRKEKIKDGY